MIKASRKQYSLHGDENDEFEISIEDACRILHALSPFDHMRGTVTCDTTDDRKQLLRTYNEMYSDGYSVKHYISEEEQAKLQIAYPATTDVFYAENAMFRIKAGIRELDPSYRRVNTHGTIFEFRVMPIFHCTMIDNISDEQARNQMEWIANNIIYKYEELNHPSYEGAKEYLEYVWSSYQPLLDSSDEFIPDIETIMEINKNFDLPWYKRYWG